ncbi:MurR/RpiR family transcriptional regulator [Mammaliicoccus sp. Dog046]|uniref:MurR/RpiR family transcriptional regulator n=1 Tax=Mammaliicoccus sp. Dog046 TaxID=3034233 RepID=UPI002B257D10|nr:MurR/RpiR family transcriptional regulator [Mammaliicoccus sp. Dog046]WQK85798.1 MurR/RpiR family transcriptional regulator [Mammaliicoccus sp. Dog046]
MEHQHLLIFIKEQMSQLTKHEQRIAQYIINHPEETINLSAQQLGKLTQTSAASIIRCSHKLNFKGFTDLKLAISRYLPSHEQSIYQEIKQDETVDSISKKLVTRAAHTLEMTEKHISSESVDRIVEQLYQSDSIIVYGVSASSLVAQDIYQKFTRIGKQVIYSLDTHLLSTAMASQTGNLTFIGISNSGENNETLSLAKVAKKYGVKIVGITQSQTSTLAKFADHYLIHDASSESSLRLAATSSLISQLMTVDILFYSYLSKDYDHHVMTMSHTRDAVELYLE